MHLQFANDRRLRAKQALYKMTEVLRWPGREPVDVVDRRYNVAVYGAESRADMKPFELAECPPAWWSPYGHLKQFAEVDREPWQEREVVKLYAEHGPQRFAGLNLFAVVAEAALGRR